MLRRVHSFSAFFENDRTTPTGLADYCRVRGFTHLCFAGLAYDFCVGYSAIDARRAGLEATILQDGCRAIDVEGSVQAIEEEFRRVGVNAGSSERLSSTFQMPAVRAH